MNIQQAFFTCLAVAIVGFLIAGLNMIRAFKSGFNVQIKQAFITHIVAGILYGLGGLGTFGFGIAWIVTYLKH
jgi:hypothetical protein